MAKKEYYLTVHGHFYQPPRENPWLEIIELQDSASPFHDWNDRIAYECYTPNSVSRIVDHNSQILDIVNNYSLISFNIGPSLLSWLEVNSLKTYERILEADKESLDMFSGHGNALAQVYNHMIMPLANERDKYTQTIWGIRDFEHRFNRKPEGIWLAETAVDDTTLKVLIDCGIKFTILSPYQAEKVRPLNDSNKEEGAKWFDVSWGNIDPGCAYRYFLKDGTDRYIDLFFYDGSISKSVAFENLLYNGDKFINRLRDGISTARDYDQLVHISTDGESYGHHTKFGDMALSYALKKRSKQVGFKITNYGEYLDKNPPQYEVEVKENSSWSCCHGVGRWRDDCGCSTGAQSGWNQKWRKPLRNALNWLRDELIIIYEKQASKYLKDPWKARNKYIDVIIDRNKSTILSFCKHESSKVLSEHEIVEVVKLLEMQRQAMLMFTSCGWFFADISGIETTQLLKYAARAMQLAEDFTEIDLENQFLCKLEEAQSNISDFGNGKSLYLNCVKPSIVSVKQVVNHWAISSLFEEHSDEINVYCYDIKSIDYKKVKKLNNTLLIGRLELISNITLEKHDMVYALMHYGGEDFHCAIRGFSGSGQYKRLKEELVSKFYSRPLTEVIRCLDENFGKDYYTLKDLFIEQRRKIVSVLIKDQLERFSSTYKSLYEEGKYPILQLMELGLQIPPEFKIAAEYTLSDTFNTIVKEADDIGNIELLQRAVDISEEAEKLGIILDKAPAKELYSTYLTEKVIELSENMDLHNLENIIRIISLTKKLKLTIDLTEAQNIYFNSIYNKVPCMISNLTNVEFVEPEKKFIGKILELGKELHLNVEHIVNELENFTG